MSKTKSMVLVSICAIGSICSGGLNVEQFSLILEGQIVRYIAQPEAGYVFRILEEKKPKLEVRSMGKENNQSGPIVLPPNARPLSKSDQESIYVVNSVEDLRKYISNIWISLDQTPVTYKAPLFSCNSVTVAVIPEIVVRIESEIDLGQLSTICQSLNLAIIKPLEFTTQEYLISVLGSSAKDVFEAVEALNNVDWIEWAAPNIASHIKPCDQYFPNDEYFPKQWHLHNTGQSNGKSDADINAPEAWEITTGDPNIVVAIIDTGVDSNHPDLALNLVPGYDFRDDDESPYPNTTDPNDNHGTACAGLVAAQGNNEIGVVGIAYNCKIMPIRIEFGEPNLTRETITATAIRWAAVHGADILSNSWGGDPGPSPIVHSAVTDVTQSGGLGRDGKGCVVVFAAGNDKGEISWPAKYPEVIAVGATDHNDAPTSYTNFGPEMDIVAPGGGEDSPADYLWTTDIVGVPGYSKKNSDPNILDYTETFSGTSAATPITAGVAALILSLEPDLMNEQVRGFLNRSARDLGEKGWDEHYGWGRIDVRAALDMVLAKRADLNNNWKVDEEDLVILEELLETNNPLGDIAPAVKRDGIVDEQDIEFLMQYLNVRIPEPGLIAHWPLNEVEGQIAHNSADENQAELYGDPTWQPTGGIVDGALLLDGIDDFVGTEYVLDPSRGWLSVFVWVKGGIPGQAIVSQLWSVNWLTTDPIQGCLVTELREASSTAQPLVSEVTITDGNWHHVGITWDGTNRTLYVDNVMVATDTQPDLVRSVEGLNIGCGPDMTPGTFWSGSIDDVRIYNTAISPMQIEMIAR